MSSQLEQEIAALRQKVKTLQIQVDEQNKHLNKQNDTIRTSQTMNAIRGEIEAEKSKEFQKRVSKNNTNLNIFMDQFTNNTDSKNSSTDNKDNGASDKCMFYISIISKNVNVCVTFDNVIFLSLSPTPTPNEQ